MTVVPIYIIADDLTGSADAANYFRRGARRVRVSFSETSPWSSSLDANVVQVFDSESRSISMEDAGLRMEQAGQTLLSSSEEMFLLYKKIDSTLRGHIGIEIESLLASTDRRVAVLAPSFPKNGRTVENGQLYVNGTLISETPFAQDPHNPIQYNAVSRIVRETTNLPVIEVSQSVLTEGIETIQKTISEASNQAILIFDARSEADLKLIAQAVAYKTDVLPCGSAGLAKELAEIWVGTDWEETNSVPGEGQPQHSIPHCERILIAVGSANPISHDQLTCAARANQSPIVELNPVALADVHSHDAEMQRGKQAVEDGAVRRLSAIALGRDRAERAMDVPGTFEEDLGIVAKHWLTCAQTLATDGGRLGFIATGGDTALALCHVLRAHAIWPEGEILPGVPWSWIETGAGNFPLVSKAGGFGSVDALNRVANDMLNQTVNQVSQ